MSHLFFFFLIKYDLDDPCANSVSEPSFNFVDKPHVPLLEVMLLKGNLIMNLLVENHVQNPSFLI
jgi:hypothetical protein